MGRIDWNILKRGSSGSTALCGFLSRLVMVSRLSKPAVEARSHRMLASGYSTLSSKTVGSVGGLVESGVAAARMRPITSGVQSPLSLLLMAPRFTLQVGSEA